MTSSNSLMNGESATPTQRLRLVPEPATPQALAPFGEVIGGPPGTNATRSNFYGEAVTVQKSAFQSSLPVELSVCTIEPRPMQVRWLERHFQHTQTFVPMGGKPFVMVLAPPGDGDLPDPGTVRAFRFDGQAGFMLGVGVWHEFPFAISPATQVAVLLTEAATRGLRSDHIIEGEGLSEDLEKRDMWKRLRTEWVVEMGDTA